MYDFLCPEVQSQSDDSHMHVIVPCSACVFAQARMVASVAPGYEAIWRKFWAKNKMKIRSMRLNPSTVYISTEFAHRRLLSTEFAHRRLLSTDVALSRFLSTEFAHRRLLSTNKFLSTACNFAHRPILLQIRNYSGYARERTRATTTGTCCRW